MQVKTTVKAGKITTNHNEAQVRPTAGLKVLAGVKAGPGVNGKINVATGGGH